MGFEYDRQLKGNWYWGARLSGTYYLGSPMTYDAVPGQNPYKNTVDQNIYKADAGLGLGYHDIFDKAFEGNGHQSLAHELLRTFSWCRIQFLKRFPVI